MIAIPYAEIVISTELDSEDIRERLLNVIGPTKDFKGKLTARGFRVRRNVRTWGRDPYHPVISGTFKPRSKGTEVDLSFWASPVEVAQVAALFGFAEYLAISRDISMWWWPLAAFVCTHLGLCLLSFAPGKRWSENRFRSALAPQ